MEKYLTQQQILEETKIPFYTLEYWIKINLVPVLKRGKGIPRLFPAKSIEIIKTRLEETRIPE